MSGPTAADQREIADLENHIATINFLLEILQLGLRNANTPALAERIDREIARQIGRLAELHARRDRLAKRLGGKGRG